MSLREQLQQEREAKQELVNMLKKILDREYDCLDLIFCDIEDLIFQYQDKEEI